MKDIRILHIFPELLSLYGEYGNISVLRHFLEKNGCTVHCDSFENGTLSTDGYDLIYIGSGTEANIREAIKRLMPHKDTLQNAINNGQLFLATGNSMAVFGKSITKEKEETPALGIFSFTTEESEKRFIGDVLTKELFGGKVIGFVNTSFVYNGITSPLFELILNKELGNDKNTPYDGFTEKNFHATQLTGPLTVKNPHILCHFIKLITDDE